MRDVIVLLSGGIDSAVVLAWAAGGDQHRASAPTEARLAGALFVDYRQPVARQEWTAACRIAHHIGTECAKFTIDGEIALGDTMRLGVGNLGARVVPGRNAMLLSLGVSWALTIGAKEVWYGANADDAHDYADCRPAFVRAFDAMSSVVYGISVKAPLITLNKSHVVRSALQHELPLDLLWSCYESETDTPCGQCNSCRIRNAAMFLPTGAFAPSP